MMDIQSIGQCTAYTSTQNARVLSNEDPVTASETAEPRRIDLRNTTINEVNAMIKAGYSELLYAVPYISPQTLGEYNYDSELIGEHKVNFIGQVETQIAFLKSRGEDAGSFENFLKDLLRIDGSTLPGEVDLDA
jgi:hypothetical protein